MQSSCCTRTVSVLYSRMHNLYYLHFILFNSSDAEALFSKTKKGKKKKNSLTNGTSGTSGGGSTSASVKGEGGGGGGKEKGGKEKVSVFVKCA